MSNTVIITGNMHTENSTYHSDICRKVWQMSNRRFIDESDAVTWGYRECEYCSGDFQAHGAPSDLHDKLLAMDAD